MSKEMREHIDRFKYFLLKENKESNDIIDYYNSKNIILVGEKTTLLPDMKRRYDFEVNGDEIYFFDKGFHFGTLFKEGRFYELRHDGTLDEYGRRNEDGNVDTSGSFLDPIGWVLKVYGRSKLDYLSDNLISNDTWWEMMEDYGKYVERNVRKNYR